MHICLADFLTSGVIMSLTEERLLLGWGKVNHLAFEDMDSCKPAFYFSDFFLKKSKPWMQYSQWMEISTEDFLQQCQESSSLSLFHWQTPSLEYFKQIFNELSHELRIGNLKKIVPYIFASCKNPMDQNHLMECLKHGIQSLKQGFGYLYGYWNERSGVLGISPELLFSHSREDSQKVLTMAVAGTCPHSLCQEKFLLDEKELYEHHLVVQGICQSLQVLGSVEAKSLQLLKWAKFSHLMTPIELRLKDDFHFVNVVYALHPTPALGAFPKAEGKAWLEKYDQGMSRRYYGAPLGFRYPQKGISSCIVGIRNVQWDSLGMYIGAGCGMVKQSILEKEWHEIQLKIKAIQTLLGLA